MRQLHPATFVEQTEIINTYPAQHASTTSHKKALKSASSHQPEEGTHKTAQKNYTHVLHRNRNRVRTSRGSLPSATSSHPRSFSTASAPIASTAASSDFSRFWSSSTRSCQTQQHRTAPQPREQQAHRRQEMTSTSTVWLPTTTTNTAKQSPARRRQRIACLADQPGGRAKSIPSVHQHLNSKTHTRKRFTFTKPFSRGPNI